MRKQKQVLRAAYSEHLDPVNCSSIISYKIYSSGKYLNASVSLTDCSRKIDWEFDNPGAVKKATKAVAILKKFRRDLIAARRKSRPNN